jgi:hypothetical protein
MTSTELDLLGATDQSCKDSSRLVLNLSNTVSSTAVKTSYIDDAVLSHSSMVSDLGILTDGRLLFKDHINSINVIPTLRRNISRLCKS